MSRWDLTDDPAGDLLSEFGSFAGVEEFGAVTREQLYDAEGFVYTDPASCSEDVRRLGRLGAARFWRQIIKDNSERGDRRFDRATIAALRKVAWKFGRKSPVFSGSSCGCEDEFGAYPGWQTSKVSEGEWFHAPRNGGEFAVYSERGKGARIVYNRDGAPTDTEGTVRQMIHLAERWNDQARRKIKDTRLGAQDDFGGVDYIIQDATHANWPGRLPYRDASSPRGYRTAEEAQRRLAQVNAHYNANYGRSPGDLWVRCRVREGGKMRYVDFGGQDEFGESDFAGRSLVDKIVAKLEADRGKAHTRILSDSDVATAVEHHRRAVRTRKPGEVIVTQVRGGFVPNSYGYRADADKVNIITADRGTQWNAQRGWAQARPYGSGKKFVIRRIKPGQAQGSVVESFGEGPEFGGQWVD